MAFVDRDIQVGVGGVVRRDGAVLLVQMGYGGARGRWIIPGGYLEPGETGAAGAAPAGAEERAGHARPERDVAVRTRVSPGQAKTDVYLVFAMTYVGGEPLADGVEVTSARFWPLAEALAHPDVVPFSQECIRAALAPGGLQKNPFVSTTAHSGWAFFSAAATPAAPPAPGS